MSIDVREVKSSHRGVLVRAATLAFYGDVAGHAGLDPDRMLADAELSGSMLLAPDSQIPARCVNLLLERSAAMSGVESFGLRMAELRSLSNLGPVGMAVRDQPTLREALAVLLRYLGWLNGAMSLSIEEIAGAVVIREDIVTGGGEPVRQSMEMATCVMVRLMRHFLGPQWRPRRICLAHAAPQDLSTHLRLFGPCVEFNYDFNGLVFAAGDLDMPNLSGDPGMARYAQQLIDSTLQDQAPSMTEDVRRVALLLLPEKRCSVEQVAQRLGLVVRTVQRRLAEDGTSFSDLVNELRVELAERFVNSSNRPLTEVAALLGFSASSGFSRWYQSQFGCSSSQARRQNKRTVDRIIGKSADQQSQQGYATVPARHGLSRRTAVQAKGRSGRSNLVVRMSA